MGAARFTWLLIVAAFVACSSTDGGDGDRTTDDQGEFADSNSPGATETNVARAQCMADDECTAGTRCVPFQDGAPLGSCVGDAGAPDGSR